MCAQTTDYGIHNIIIVLLCVHLQIVVWFLIGFIAISTEFHSFKNGQLTLHRSWFFFLTSNNGSLQGTVFFISNYGESYLSFKCYKKGLVSMECLLIG